MTIAKSFNRMDCIERYFESCPHIKKGQIKVDWIADSVFKDDLKDKDEKKTLRKFDFLLTVENPMENPLYLSRKIIEWMEEQKNLPKLKGEETAVCMNPVRSLIKGGGVGITCRLLYDTVS